MREVIVFFLKFRLFILFIFLEFISMFLTFSKIYIHKNIYDHYLHYIIGMTYKIKQDIQSYIVLKRENQKLIEENAMLRKQLKNSKIEKSFEILKKIDTIYLQKYIYMPVKIINNSIFQQENFFIINKGELDGIGVDMGVILPDGIAGIIIKTSSHFSTAISLLNTQIKINARLKKSKHFGTIIWDGINHDTVILKDIPKHVSITLGEVIETDSRSTIFPEGIIIGKIKDFKFDKENSIYNIKVKLKADLSAIESAYVVKNLFKKELEKIKMISYK